jgi:hypothetical protein
VGTDNQVDQPWSHSVSGGSIIPIPPDYPHSDLPAVLGPCGLVHVSVKDWAKFIMIHLEGAKGGSQLLKPETFKILHTPPFGTEYALGWGVENDNLWTDGTILWHTGSNTVNWAHVWISTERDFTVLVTTNISRPRGSSASDEVIITLIEKFLPEE